MAETTSQQVVYGLRVETVLRRGLAALVVGALLLELHLLFIKNVNWDEFHYLNWVYIHLRGELTNTLQTGHVHFFAWLRNISVNEVDQVIAARLVVYAIRLGSVYLIYRIGRRFFDCSASLFAVLCYLSFSFVLEHGASFRADPFATFFSLASLYFVLSAQRWLLTAAAGLAAAAAIMITIKSVFYLPVLGCVLLLSMLNSSDRRRSLLACFTVALSFAAGFAMLYLLHRSSLASADLQQAGGFVTKSANKVIRFDRLLPGRFYLLHSLIENAVIWFCLLAGAALAVRDCLRGAEVQRRRASYLLLFLLPLVAFLIYRNTFPYFYAFILPLPILLCGLPFAWLMQAKPGNLIKAPRLIAFGLCLAVSVNLAKHYLANAEPGTEQQRATIDLVHKLFPEPVAYIDRCDMIASHRKVGLFMSTWGMERYLERNQPVFRDLLIEERPLYLIANIPSLSPLVDQDRLRSAGHYVLLHEDQAVLRDNFVHHWGALFVAGKTLGFTELQDRLEFEILIPGRYTLEAAVPIELDGRLIEPGTALDLTAGWHGARRLDGGRGRAILRWGEGLYRPAHPAPPWPLFAGF